MKPKEIIVAGGELLVTGAIGLALFYSREVFSEQISTLVGGHNTRGALEHIGNGFLMPWFGGLVVDSNPLKFNDPTKEQSSWIFMQAVMGLSYLGLVAWWELISQFSQRGFIQWEQVAGDVGGLTAGIALNYFYRRYLLPVDYSNNTPHAS